MHFRHGTEGPPCRLHGVDPADLSRHSAKRDGGRRHRPHSVQPLSRSPACHKSPPSAKPLRSVGPSQIAVAPASRGHFLALLLALGFWHWFALVCALTAPYGISRRTLVECEMPRGAWVLFLASFCGSNVARVSGRVATCHEPTAVSCQATSGPCADPRHIRIQPSRESKTRRPSRGRRVQNQSSSAPGRLRPVPETVPISRPSAEIGRFFKLAANLEVWSNRLRARVRH